MLLPFIYTRTKFHDYSVVTSSSLKDVSNSFMHFATESARMMIAAENSELVNPSWALVKKDGYVLWGMSIVNKALGDKSQDLYGRPIRGFFGFISNSQISTLPYDIAYFKKLYDLFIVPIWELPIWESYEQTVHAVGVMPQPSEFDHIEKSQRLAGEINKEENICRFFPSDTDSRALIEAIFASVEDCSIATNIHSKEQCVDFGDDKISFTNAVMASGTKLNKTEDVKVFVKKNIEDNTPDTPIENNIDIQKKSVCPICGNPVEADEYVCKNCRNKQQNKKYIKYGLYVFMAFLCLLFIVKGPSIWEKILPSKSHTETISHEEGSNEGECEQFQESKQFLTTNKSEIHIQDATIDDIFRIKYDSSSKIKRVESSTEWINIKTTPGQYAESGVVEFCCNPLNEGAREGAIFILNKEGNKIIINVYQTTSDKYVRKNKDNDGDAIKVVTPNQLNKAPSSAEMPDVTGMQILNMQSQTNNTNY